MDKPNIKNKLTEHYLDYLKNTYEPTKTAAGQDYINSPLTYCTFEQDFLSTDKELDFVAAHGFAPIGFLVALRMNMSTGLGYGIRIGRPLNRALCTIGNDTDISVEILKGYYDLLLDSGFLIIIDDSEGNQVVTTRNQLYNWELKEYTKWCNNEKQKKARKRQKNKATSKSTTAPDFVEEPLSDDEIYAMAAAQATEYDRQLQECCNPDINGCEEI